MLGYSRFKNRLISKIAARFPAISRRVIASYDPLESHDIPWAPILKPLDRCKVALVTTAGIHLKSQEPFDMHDRDGDPSFREIDSHTETSDLVITHDNYDHSDADKDKNIVFPMERLQEFALEGLIGEAAPMHYGFMGHITGQHIVTLIEKSAPQVASLLKKQQVDSVLLTPG